MTTLPLTITDLAARYASLPSPQTPSAAEHHAYAVAGLYFRRKAAEIIAERNLSVHLVPIGDPYDTAQEQTADIQANTLRVSTLYCDHPIWDPFTNYAYRIVHDVTGHAPPMHNPGGITHPFNVDGELRAWQRHVAAMVRDGVPNHVIRVAFSETVLQLAYAAVTGDFHPTQPVTLCNDLSVATLMHATIVDDRVVNEVCDNCGSPLVVVRSREGRFCTSECAEAFELS